MVDVEDTDVAVIASYASFRFENELLFYRKKENTTMQAALSGIYVICHHIFTCTYWSLCGQWLQWTFKKAIYEKVKKSEEAKQLITNFEMYDILSEEDNKKCSMFLISFIYADKTSLTISQARSRKWKAMKNKQHYAFH